MHVLLRDAKKGREKCLYDMPYVDKLLDAMFHTGFNPISFQRQHISHTTSFALVLLPLPLLTRKAIKKLFLWQQNPCVTLYFARPTVTATLFFSTSFMTTFDFDSISIYMWFNLLCPKIVKFYSTQLGFPQTAAFMGLLLHLLWMDRILDFKH